MAIRNFALVAGIVYLAVGVMGFIPTFLTPAPDVVPELFVHSGYGYLMGIFPVNILHNIVHLGVGLWGLVSYRTPRSAWFFAAGLAIFYSVLAAMGFVPVLGTSLGMIPIFGNDILLHAGTAFLAGYFAFVRRSPEVSIGQPSR